MEWICKINTDTSSPVAQSVLSSKHDYQATDMLMSRKKLVGITHLSAWQQRIKLNDTIVAAQCCYTNATNAADWMLEGAYLSEQSVAFCDLARCSWRADSFQLTLWADDLLGPWSPSRRKDSPGGRSVFIGNWRHMLYYKTGCTLHEDYEYDTEYTR